MEQLLTVQEVSEMLRVSCSTLNNWRASKEVVIPFLRIGRKIRYRMSDVEAFVERQVTSSAGGEG